MGTKSLPRLHDSPGFALLGCCSPFGTKYKAIQGLRNPWSTSSDYPRAASRTDKRARKRLLGLASLVAFEWTGFPDQSNPDLPWNSPAHIGPQRRSPHWGSGPGQLFFCAKLQSILQLFRQHSQLVEGSAKPKVERCVGQGSPSTRTTWYHRKVVLALCWLLAAKLDKDLWGKGAHHKPPSQCQCSCQTQPCWSRKFTGLETVQPEHQLRFTCSLWFTSDRVNLLQPITSQDLFWNSGGDLYSSPRWYMGMFPPLHSCEGWVHVLIHLLTDLISLVNAWMKPEIHGRELEFSWLQETISQTPKRAWESGWHPWFFSLQFHNPSLFCPRFRSVALENHLYVSIFLH